MSLREVFPALHLGERRFRVIKGVAPLAVFGIGFQRIGYYYTGNAALVNRFLEFGSRARRKRLFGRRILN